MVFFSEENGQGTAWPALGSIADFAGLGIAGRIRSFRLVELTENVALDKEVTGSDGTGDEVWKINDGLASRWISEEAVGAWLCIDLETPYWLNRYAVRHAGTAGEDALYNTSAFTIQCSTDGQQWTTVSTVLGNVDDMTDETVAPFKAQYVRLRIDRPNSSRFEPDRGCIVEFELYGLPAYENEGPVIGDAPMDDPQWQPSEEESAQGDSTEPSDEETPSPTKRKLVKKTVITRDNLWILWVGIGVGAAILAAVLVLVIRKKKKAASANDQPERSEEA